MPQATIYRAFGANYRRLSPEYPFQTEHRLNYLSDRPPSTGKPTITAPTAIPNLASAPGQGSIARR